MKILIRILLFFILSNIYARTINFSGYTWNVKSALNSKAGPGPNYFSDDVSDVWVDGDGKLHLKIVYRDGKWFCTEVYNQASLGYGEYIFYLESKIQLLDKNIVIGFFTWDNNAPQYNYREIDIEFSKWGIANNQNSQFVVQPYSIQGNIYRFDTILNDLYSTHKFCWKPDGIIFTSLYGHKSVPVLPSDIINFWEYAGNYNPPPGQEKIDINFWLVNGNPPSDFNNAEIVVKKFEFIPLTSLPTPTPTVTSGILDEAENFYIKQIKIYPNPVKNYNKMNIRFNKKGYKIVKVTIYNLKGEKIKQLITEDTQIIWNLSTDENYLVSSGIYVFVFDGIDNSGNIIKENILKAAVIN